MILFKLIKVFIEVNYYTNTDYQQYREKVCTDEFSYYIAIKPSYDCRIVIGSHNMDINPETFYRLRCIFSIMAFFHRIKSPLIICLRASPTNLR